MGLTGRCYMQPNPQNRKKPRLEQLRAETERIPSSQSDEEELQSRTPRISPTDSSGTESRKSILPLTPDHGDEDLHMDLDEPANPRPQTKLCQTPPKNPSQEQMLTPPLSDLPSSPPSPTPVVMDAAKRTADFIARIREEAERKVESSPEPASPVGSTPYDFESSDDEEPDPFLFMSYVYSHVSLRLPHIFSARNLERLPALLRRAQVHRLALQKSRT